MFEFYNECLKNKSQFYRFKEIEEHRKKLFRSDELIHITDLGAGSLVNKNKSRSVKDIAKNSLKQPFLAQQLYRIVNFLKPQNLIEIGTSLGITTSYLASPYPSSSVFTLEGCQNSANVAKKTFQSLNFDNIKVVEGDFKATLPDLINKMDSVDFVYFDGNHQYEPTIEYFRLCKQKKNENTCFIFDDIYWSKGMKKAWLEIQADQDVKISIDTFYFGICFFRTNQPKQHFVLK